MSHAFDGYSSASDVDHRGSAEKSDSEPSALRPTARGPRWRSEYARRLAITDLVVLALTTAASTILRFGLDSSSRTGGSSNLSYSTVGVAIVAAWWIALTYFATREPKIIGEGVDEYRRIVRATFVVFGCLAIVSLLTKSDLSRSYLAFSFPLGLTGLLMGRKMWRTRLATSRRSGKNVSHVLVIGGARSAKRITQTLDGNVSSGYRVTGVWVPDRLESLNESLDVPGRFIPVLGTSRTLADALFIAEADTVIVTDTEHLGHDGLKTLAWELEGADIDLLVSPNVIDVAGPRIHIRGVANMPLIHLDRPQYAEAARITKTVFDKSVAALTLFALSPVMLAAAIAVKLSSRGPVLYRSVRVGVGGQTFDMLKFRSMAVDAELHLAKLATTNEGAGPLFKMRDDPRVTRVGKFLRRFSIDETPQLFNVLKGEMSLVGPRPPLPAEVAAYEGHIDKRLLVRQGITGLWQVSGRSDLTWDETVRLDLDYVENWSMARDLQIIWRTVRAVFKSEGAY